MANTYEQRYANNTRVVTGLLNRPKQDDSILLCDTSAGAVAIELLTPATQNGVGYWSTQYKLYVVDSGNNAAVNNITIIAPAGCLVNGSPTFTINSNGATLLLRIVSNTKYIGQYSVIGGGFYQTVQLNSVSVTQRQKLNFLGDNVTITDNAGNNSSDVTILPPYLSVTNAQLLTLISTNLIKPSYTYLVTDALLTNGGVLIQGVTTNSVSLFGSGIFLNADYQGVGNYSGVAPFGTTLGIWYPTYAGPIAIGDVVIWNNLHYKNLTGVWGTFPSGDAINWQVLAKTTTTGYIQEIDEVTYNSQFNTILSRKDKRSNYLQLDSTGTNITQFQWGRDNVFENTIIGNSTMLIANSFASLYNNHLSTESTITDTTSVPTNGEIYNNTLVNNSQLQSLGTFGTIYSNLITSNSLIKVEYLSNTGQIALNFLAAASQINLDQVYGTVNANTLETGLISLVTGTLDVNSQVGGNLINTTTSLSLGNLTSTIINQNIITNFASLVITNGNGGTFQQNLIQSPLIITNLTNTFSNNTLSLDGTFITINSVSTFTVFKVCRSGYSNFEYTLDFNTDYNLGTQTLTIPAASTQHIGIFKLSNTASNTVTNIANCPTKFPVNFIPDNAQVVSFAHTSITTAVADNLVSDAGTFTNTLNGRTNGSDFVEYKKSGNLLVRNNIVVLI
jgi:hypothetical protein